MVAKGLARSAVLRPESVLGLLVLLPGCHSAGPRDAGRVWADVLASAWFQREVLAKEGVGFVGCWDETRLPMDVDPTRPEAAAKALPQLAGQDASVLADFLVRNRTRASLAGKVAFAGRITFLPERDFADWESFHASHAGCAGILTLSQPGFSADGSQALLYVAWQTSSLGGKGFLVLLRFDGDRWQAKDSRILWIS